MGGLGEMNRREGWTETGIKDVQKNKEREKKTFPQVELDVCGVEEETDSQGGLSRREHYRVICSFSSNYVE